MTPNSNNVQANLLLVRPKHKEHHKPQASNRVTPPHNDVMASERMTSIKAGATIISKNVALITQTGGVDRAAVFCCCKVIAFIYS